MFRNLKNNRGQNTAEYALLIALVVAGIIAMQQYSQRALQARVRDASQYLTSDQQFGGKQGLNQYEPYYSQSNYVVGKESTEAKRQGDGLIASESDVQRNRQGSQVTNYDSTGEAQTGE